MSLVATDFGNVFSEEIGISFLVINLLGLIESKLQLVEELLIIGWNQL